MMTSPRTSQRASATRPVQPEIFLRDGVISIRADQTMGDRKRVVVRYGGRGRKVIVELFGNGNSGSFTYLVETKKVIGVQVSDPHRQMEFHNQTTLWVTKTD